MTAQTHAVGAAGVTQAAATAASRPRSSPATLVANFELLAEADGGASRLRMLILDLAVRGLLTEPVSTGPSAVDDGLDVSLEAFTSPHVTEQEDLLAAAALPANNWIRTKLGNVVVLSYGKSLPKKARNAYGKIPTYGSNGAVGFHDESLIHEPCLVIGRKGSSGAVNVTNGPSWPIDTTYFVVPPKGLTLQFLFILLRAIRLDRFDRSTAIPGLNRTDAYALTVLLPPLAEQKRIVAKVAQLMALCDELEARQTKKRETGTRLTKSALEALTTAETPEDFNRAWTRVSENIDVLIDRTEKVMDLRGAILELAVRGMLSSSKLPAAAPEGDPKPFAVPGGWLWSKVGEMFEVSGGIQKTPARTPKNNHYPYLRVENVQRGRLDLSKMERFELAAGELERWHLEKGDLLVVEGNGSEKEIGRCAIWAGEIEDCVHQNHIIRCRALGPMTPAFTILFLNSPSGMSTMKALAITTSGLFSLSVGKVRGIDVPVPPVDEQERIVAKVAQLMRFCDELESRLNLANNVAAEFAEAAVLALLG